MTRGGRPRRRENAFALVRRVVSGGVALVRLELTRGRQEIGEMIAETKTAAIFFGVAAAMGLLTMVTLDLVIVLGVAALFDAIVDIAVVIIIVAVFVLVAIGFGIMGVANLWVIVGLLVVAAAFAVPAYLGFTATWLSALFVLVVQMSIVALLALRGIRQVRIGPPEETIASVKEDIEWAKRLLRRE